MVDTQQHHVAAQVRRRRLDRGWTLDAAALRLGVSRRLLAQIEAGDSNPSLSTLLAIASGFEVALVDLLAQSESRAITVQPDNTTASVLWRGPSGGYGRLLVASGGLELWEWMLESGEERRSDAHRPRSHEALTVASGTLTLKLVGAQAAQLRRGQSAAFPADVGHRYANKGSETTSFLLAVHETT